MTFRNKQIYVSSNTKRRLFWIHRLCLIDDSVKKGEQVMTVDAIAEHLLNKQIESDYPNIKALEKRLNALEEQLVSELLSPSAQTPMDA